MSNVLEKLRIKGVQTYIIQNNGGDFKAAVEWNQSDSYSGERKVRFSTKSDVTKNFLIAVDCPTLGEAREACEELAFDSSCTAGNEEDVHQVAEGETSPTDETVDMEPELEVSDDED